MGVDDVQITNNSHRVQIIDVIIRLLFTYSRSNSRQANAYIPLQNRHSAHRP